MSTSFRNNYNSCKHQQSRPKRSPTLSIKPCLSLLIFSRWTLIIRTSFYYVFHSFRLLKNLCTPMSSHVCAVSTQQYNTFQSTKLKTNNTGWAKDGQSSHLIKPNLHLMTVKVNSTGEAQNMSSKWNKNKTKKQKCAQFKVNAHKHLTNHIAYVSQKVNTQQAVATLLDRKTYVMVTF